MKPVQKLKFQHPLRITLLIVLVYAASACSGVGLDRVGGKSKSEGKTDGDVEFETEDEAAALTDEQAVEFLVTNCIGCHGKGADLHSTWPMPDKENLNVETLQSMTTAASAYQGMVNKFINAGSDKRPSAMPPGTLGGESRRKLKGMLYWFKLNLPAVVKEAEDTYGQTDRFRSTLNVTLNYQCDSRTSTRNYLFRLFNQALGRLPTPEEEAELVPKDEADAPISDKRKSALAAVITTGKLKDAFLDYGLKIFAKRVGGSGAIKPAEAFGLNALAADDLKDEFYQLLRKYVAEKSYRDILLLNKVMVTKNTAPLYNEAGATCASAGDGWSECELSEMRANFFGTIGFLNSTPSSFLASNNNYARGGEIHAILRGERLMAQTDGPVGDKPGPVPDCAPTQDRRVVLNDPAKEDAGMAPRGAMAVPAEGAVCQGCHLNKYLNVASYVFRPFDERGLTFTAEKINVAATNPYADMVKAAVAPDIKNITDLDSKAIAPVSVEYLQSLLAENEQSQEQCIADRTAKKVLTQVKNIGDLTGYMIGKGEVLIHGLSRYIPSALSNLPMTNQEIITSVSRGFSKGDGKLLPVFKAYFESETFSCAVGD
jgi:hypothetical protein